MQIKNIIHIFLKKILSTGIGPFIDFAPKILIDLLLSLPPPPPPLWVKKCTR